MDAEAQAEAKNWPDGLLARARAARTPRWQLQQMLTAWDPWQVERALEVMERTTGGALRARDLTFRDEESFSELWASAAETIGDWQVTVERSPNAVAQYRLQGDVCLTVAEELGQIVACTVWSAQNCLVSGRRTSVSYATGLRVHDGHRRKGLGDIVRRYPPRALQKPALGQVMFLRVGNTGAAGFFEAVKFQAGAERPQKLAQVTHLTPPAPAETAGLRAASEDDLAACAALINRTHGHLDLFTPLTGESLYLALNEGSWGPKAPWRAHVYGLEDLFVLEAGGEIVACGGLWDRGRDIRERWKGPAGEEKVVEAAALLDFGCAAGREADLAALIRHLAGLAGAKGRQSLMAALEHLPAAASALADLDPNNEARTLEWTPYLPEAPRQLGEAFTDLRYW